jgi:hypothetical protein
MILGWASHSYSFLVFLYTNMHIQWSKYVPTERYNDADTARGYRAKRPLWRYRAPVSFSYSFLVYFYSHIDSAV